MTGGRWHCCAGEDALVSSGLRQLHESTHAAVHQTAPNCRAKGVGRAGALGGHYSQLVPLLQDLQRESRVPRKLPRGHACPEAARRESLLHEIGPCGSWGRRDSAFNRRHRSPLITTLS